MLPRACDRAGARGHGAELRTIPGAAPESPRLPPLDPSVKRRFAAIAEVGPGIILEDKGYSLALHYRLAPEKEGMVREAAAKIVTELKGAAIELLPGKLVVSADYSANRSTHLPWGGNGGICGCGPTTRDRNFIPSAIRRQFNTLDLFNELHNTVNNPFLPLFVGPNAIFNEPDSLYNNAQIPLINLLRPFPQFDGPFEGLPLLLHPTMLMGSLPTYQLPEKINT